MSLVVDVVKCLVSLFILLLMKNYRHCGIDKENVDRIERKQTNKNDKKGLPKTMMLASRRTEGKVLNSLPLKLKVRKVKV